MNPDTNEFELLRSRLCDLVPEDRGPVDCVKQQYLEMLEETGTNRLVRPSGEPVPSHWSVFTVGEKVVIKDYTFEVMDISKDRILFRPVGLSIVGE